MKFSLDVASPNTGKIAHVVGDTVPIAGVAWLTNARLVYPKLEPGPPFKDFNLWTIDVNRNTGEPRGKPKRLTQWTGFNIHWLSASSDGKVLAFVREDSQTDVYVSRLEAGGVRMTVPQRLTLDDHDDNATAWMPDNRTVLFESNRSGEMHVYRQSIDSPSAELVIGGPDQQYQPRIAPGGQWLLYLQIRRPLPKQNARLMRMPLAGGGSAEEVLVVKGAAQSFQCSRAAGGACVLNELSGQERVVSLFDPATGSSREITRNPMDVGDAAISRDGKHIAFATGRPRNHIRILTVDGKAEREVVVNGVSRLMGLDWSADGESFLCGDVAETESSVLRVEPDGTSQVLWRQSGNHDIWAVPSADGKYVAIHGATESANVWMVRNPG